MANRFLDGARRSAGSISIRPGQLLGGTAALMMPLAVFVPLGLAPLFLLSAAAGLTLCLLSGRSIFPLPVIPSVLLFGFAAWGAVSASWSVEPMVSLKRALALATLFGAGLILVVIARRLEPAERSFVAKALIASLSLGLVFMLIELSTDGLLYSIGKQLLGTPLRTDLPEGRYLSTLNRGTTVVAFMVWPAFMALQRMAWNRTSYIMIVLVAAILSQTQTAAAVIAIFVGAVVFAFVYLRPKISLFAVGAVTAVGILLAPVFPKTILAPKTLIEQVSFLPNSAYHRLFIWEIASGWIMERPTLGWGLDSSRFMSRGRAIEDYEFRLKEGERRVRFSSEPMPLHPHNAPLQWWLEVGAIGALLGAGLVVATIASCLTRTLEPADRAASAALIASALTVATVSFGAWQTWWLSALWLGAVFALCVARRTGSVEA